MAVQIEVSNRKRDKVLSFPKLMIYRASNLVVWFTAPRHGMVVVRGKSAFTCGDILPNLNFMEEYEDFQGSVTISNMSEEGE
tara:strand:+ start:385 stop:630 length:246 start_codon:yes stop_codon:yes gene_type:complete